MADALGTVSELVVTAGVIKQRSLSTAWVEPQPSDTFNFTKPIEARYGFTQRERDDESGLSCMDLANLRRELDQ